MAKQSSITYQRVRAAAERLRAEGRPVTNKAVRLEMGEGSYQTIAPLLRRVKEEWRQEEETAARLAAANFPSDIASAYYSNVQREKDALKKNLRQEMDDQRIQLEEAEEAIAETQAEIEDLAEQLTRERAEAADKIRGLEIAAGGQRERMEMLDDALRQLRSERDGVLADKEALASDKTRLQHDLERCQQDLQDARKRFAHLEAQVDSLQKELAASSQRTAVAERHAADTQNLCEDLRARCRSLEEDCRGLQAEHRVMTARLLEQQGALAASADMRPAENIAAQETARERSKTSGKVQARPEKSGNGSDKA